MNKLGERLKAARLLAGCSTVRAGSIIAELPYQSFRDYENGRSLPGAHATAQLCSAFGVSSDYLLGLAPMPKPRKRASRRA